MAWRERVQTVVVVLLLVAAVKMAQELYGWVAYADERARLRGFVGELEETGVHVVRTQMRADSLQRSIERLDLELDRARRVVVAFESDAVGGAIPQHLYPAYRRSLDAYNRQVRTRNAWLTEWRAVVEENRAAVDRYNAVADSMRRLAGAMGDPYYQVPSPVEVAVRHGVAPPARRKARE